MHSEPGDIISRGFTVVVIVYSFVALFLFPVYVVRQGRIFGSDFELWAASFYAGWIFKIIVILCLATCVSKEFIVKNGALAISINVILFVILSAFSAHLVWSLFQPVIR